jgi:hypothetical protein
MTSPTRWIGGNSERSFAKRISRVGSEGEREGGEEREEGLYVRGSVIQYVVDNLCLPEQGFGC